VLVYSTHTLDKGVTAIGEVRGLFYVSSSAPDCDLTLKLVDVYPDGKAFNLGDTMLRLRYRNGFDKVQLMRGGQIYRIAMKGIVTGNYFGPGHRIRIELAGSNFPNAERNLQTGGLNFSETKALPATIQIWHDHDHQSFVELTVVKQP
jgi:putative CocE/NonD family hydrolase